MTPAAAAALVSAAIAAAPLQAPADAEGPLPQAGSVVEVTGVAAGAGAAPGVIGPCPRSGATAGMVAAGKAPGLVIISYSFRGRPFTSSFPGSPEAFRPGPALMAPALRVMPNAGGGQRPILP